MTKTNVITENEKEQLFQRIIINNAPNRFVYNQLKQSLIDMPSMIVPFIGAGLSKFAYKAWGALLQDLLDQLADQAIDAPKRAKIQDEITRRDFFSAADDLETLIESDVFFFSLVSACNESKLLKEGIPDNAAVKWLPKVFPDARIITTNYDCVLEMAYAQEKKYLRVCTPSDSRMFMQFMPRRLFKIHGSYDSNYEDIVLTSRSYEKKYAKGSLLYNNFKHVVQSSILLFLGASLQTDKTLDILKESAIELSVDGHYCGNMHYAIVHISSDEDKIRRRQELATYKILPILYSDTDCDGFSDRHIIVSIILEKLYKEVTNQFIRRTGDISTPVMDEYYNSDETSPHYHDSGSLRENRVDTQLIAQLIKENPVKAFTYALSENDLTLAENMLGLLEHAIPHEVYVTKIVSALASRGSTRAANYLFNSLSDILQGGYTPSQIVSIAGSLVSYCNRLDKEADYLETIKMLLEKAKQNASDDENASICNQMSRLYYGMYRLDKGKIEYKEYAKKYIEQAIAFNGSEPSYYYNLAIILEEDDISSAIDAIHKCIDLGTNDIDHLLLAEKLLKKANDPRSQEVAARIQAIDPIIAQISSLHDA